MAIKSEDYISIIIPTYSERSNIGILLERIDKCLENIKYEIVIVDDNSPDGTAELVKELSNTYNIKLIIRKDERGLATAVAEGFRHASGNIFVVMDADLQHPPERIIPLIEEIDKGTDIVVASRYNEEKGFGEFNIFRKIISKGANALARILFQKLSNIKDIQSGFFVLKKDVIQGVVLKPVGYKILLEILIIGNYKNIKEIGYTFSKRENGDSKLGAKTIIDYIYHLIYLSLRTGDLKRFTKYSIIGISGIFVNTFVLYFFTSILGVFYLLSSAVAYEISILTNFLLNDTWTFKDIVIDGKSHNFVTRAIYYNSAMITGAILGIFLLYVFTNIFSIHYVISNLISIFIVFLWRYYASITMVWKRG